VVEKNQEEDLRFLAETDYGNTIGALQDILVHCRIRGSNL